MQKKKHNRQVKLLSDQLERINRCNSEPQRSNELSAYYELTHQIVPKQMEFWSRLVGEKTSYHTERVNPWIDICNRNGFKRQESLELLDSGAPSAFLFGLLIRRLNDWAPKVRSAAREALIRVARKTHRDIITQSYWFSIPNLYTWRRTDEKELTPYWDLIAQPANIEKIALLIRHSRSGPAANILSQIGRSKNIDKYLPFLALSAVQPSVRAVSYKMMIENKAVWLGRRQWEWLDKKYSKHRVSRVKHSRTIDNPIWSLEECIYNASVDRSPIVRKLAAQATIDHQIGDFMIKIGQRLLNDRFSFVSERAKFALRKITESPSTLPTFPTAP